MTTEAIGRAKAVVDEAVPGWGIGQHSVLIAS